MPESDIDDDLEICNGCGDAFDPDDLDENGYCDDCHDDYEDDE